MSVQNGLDTLHQDGSTVPLVSARGESRMSDHPTQNGTANSTANGTTDHTGVEMTDISQHNVQQQQAGDSFGNLFNSISKNLKVCRTLTRKRLLDVLYVASFLAYVVYLGFVVNYDIDHLYFSIVDGGVFLLFVIHRFMKLQDIVRLITKPIVLRTKSHGRSCIHPLVRKYFRRVLTGILYAALVVFLATDAYDDPHRLIPLGGMVFLLLVLFVTSRSPFKVKWTPVLWGILLQFMMGIIILRWKTGYEICKAIGDLMADFLAFTDYGSKFVFGETGYTLHIVAFKILPVVVYFSAFVSILYYYGIMQFFIKWIAKLFQLTMNTTAIESFATAAHIFIGAVESTVAMKPFFADLTSSELNAVMTGGFATVAGTVIAAYIEFGIPPEHVISASFMSAPAALAVAKLSWPEREETADKDRAINLDVGKELNVMEAASNGATAAVKLVAYVVVNLIAFISILEFINYSISFMGGRVGHPEVNFEWFCSYIFMPLAVIMGVHLQDCRKVAALIGKKIFINEFLSFADLGKLIKNGELESRSVVIATYILCGFGSVAAMGINLGAYTAAEPKRRQHFAKGILRALICGNIACFMTACVAGMLYHDMDLSVPSNTTMAVNITSNSTFIFQNITTPITTLNTTSVS